MFGERGADMGVFDSKIKTERRVKDPGTDKKLSAGGALSYAAIASTTALAGCPGVYSQLIHGVKWIQIDTNQTEMITSDVLQKIGGN